VPEETPRPNRQLPQPLLVHLLAGRGEGGVRAAQIGYCLSTTYEFGRLRLDSEPEEAACASACGSLLR